MPKNILVVTGSIRKGRVADTILEHVKTEIAKHEDLDLVIADLKELNLPFFDSEDIPMSPTFKPTNENVLAWTKLVGDADGVILLTPEYNHSLSAVQKNAIDWIYTEWIDKPVSVISYGWSGGSLAQADLQEVLGNLKAKQLPTVSKLRFMKDINPDGSLLDADTVNTAIKATIDELENEL